MMSLEKEFTQTVDEIRKRNWFSIIKKLVNFIRDDYYEHTGLLLTDDECLPYAQDLFAEAKKQGKFNDLNYKVEE